MLRCPLFRAILIVDRSILVTARTIPRLVLGIGRINRFLIIGDSIRGLVKWR